MPSLIIKSSVPAPIDTEATVSIVRIIKLFLLIAAIVIAVVTGWLGYQKWVRWKQATAFREYVANVDTLFGALQQYKERAGAYPAGGNAEIFRSLSGKNDKNLLVIIPTKMAANEKGEFTDPWGTPVRIYFGTSGVTIRSAGPNKLFEDARSKACDDIFLSN
ncbi:MAG: hypothetical protein HY301_06265 [Verrucomicrobia bacterium]|nr:hypothetical protein [Verrucomicrobiota bacterium]